MYDYYDICNNERWLNLPDIDFFKNIDKNKYQISSFGRILKYNEDGSTEYVHQSLCHKHYRVMLFYNGNYVTISVCKLVMLTFSYREDYKLYSINHLNFDPSDNRIANLCWSDNTVCGLKLIIRKFPELPCNEGEYWMPILRKGITKDINTDGYFISNHGRVCSINKSEEINMITGVDRRGYNGIYFRNTNENNKRTGKPISTHRLVMNNFKYNPNYENFQVNHIDGNKLNNHINNLEWCTPKYNTQHAYATNLVNSIGEDNYNCKYSDELIYDIFSLYILKYKTKNIIDKIYDKYKISIKIDLINEVLCGRNRLRVLINFLIDNEATPNKIFTKDELIYILKVLANADFIFIDFMNYIKSMDINKYSLKYLCIVAIYSIGSKELSSLYYFFDM